LQDLAGRFFFLGHPRHREREEEEDLQHVLEEDDEQELEEDEEQEEEEDEEHELEDEELQHFFLDLQQVLEEEEEEHELEELLELQPHVIFS
jgi:hypothetical protein